jgi:hypothetical protein
MGRGSSRGKAVMSATVGRLYGMKMWRRGRRRGRRRKRAQRGGLAGVAPLEGTFQ